jgi:hypothetical protein
MSQGELGRANEYFTRAYLLREHASDREKVEPAAVYYENVSGDLDRAIDPTF